MPSSGSCATTRTTRARFAIERTAAGQRSTLVLHFGAEPVELSAITAPLGRQLATRALVLHSDDPEWATADPQGGDDQLAPWSARLYVERVEGP